MPASRLSLQRHCTATSLQRRRGAFPGAQALGTSGAVVVAGLIFSIHEAKRVRDMRKYPFWARTAQSFEIMSDIAPGKILRDSPTQRGTPKKIGRKAVGRCFGQ